MTDQRIGRRLARFLAVAVTLGLVLSSLSAGNTLAAKRSGSTTSSSSSLTLVMVSDANGNGAPNWGDSITWNLSTTATSTPYVGVSCYQNGTQVYSASAGYFAGYPWPSAQTMKLASGAWTSGGASCTAVLYYSSGRKTVIDTSISFTAGA